VGGVLCREIYSKLLPLEKLCGDIKDGIPNGAFRGYDFF
jgi:hypothetical protein